jgi:hypothetical protein
LKSLQTKHKNAALQVGKQFEGIPIVDSYKYLGVWINQKLSPDKHIEYLFGTKRNDKEGIQSKKGKISFLTICLSSCLNNISFDYRISLWTTFIRPLFLPLAALAPTLNQTDRNKIETKLRTSIKKFLKLPQNFKSEILHQIFPIDLNGW